MTVSSVRVGTTQYGNDYAQCATAPTGGTLFCAWVKMPDPGVIPWTRGNVNVYQLFGNNWSIEGIIGNSSNDGAGNVFYNANTMLFGVLTPPASYGNPGTYVQDMTSFNIDNQWTDPQVRDWTWIAWQVVVSGGNITANQWIKVGGTAVYGPTTTSLTLATMRAGLVSAGWTSGQANAWTPTDATSWQLMADSGADSEHPTIFYHDVIRVKMYAQSSVPSNATLESIAAQYTADSTAWGDYHFDWETGAALLTNRSGGSGPALTIGSGGTLYQGSVGPAEGSGGVPCGWVRA